MTDTLTKLEAILDSVRSAGDFSGAAQRALRNELTPIFATIRAQAEEIKARDATISKMCEDAEAKSQWMQALNNAHRAQSEALAVAREGLGQIKEMNVRDVDHAPDVATDALARIDALTGKGEG